MLVEQFGGPNGESAAALQYTVQGLNCEDRKQKDLLIDIGTEEISHLEALGTVAPMHLKPTRKERAAAEANPLISIVVGGGVGLVNSTGVSWTADYLKISSRWTFVTTSLRKPELDSPTNACSNSAKTPGSKDAFDVPEDARDRAHEVVHASTREPG